MSDHNPIWLTWEQVAVAAATVGGILFGFATSVAWFVVVVDATPPSISNQFSPELGALGFFVYMAGIVASCVICGAKAQKCVERYLRERRRGPST